MQLAPSPSFNFALKSWPLNPRRYSMAAAACCSFAEAWLKLGPKFPLFDVSGGRGQGWSSTGCLFWSLVGKEDDEE